MWTFLPCNITLCGQSVVKVSHDCGWICCFNGVQVSVQLCWWRPGLAHSSSLSQTCWTGSRSGQNQFFTEPLCAWGRHHGETGNSLSTLLSVQYWDHHFIGLFSFCDGFTPLQFIHLTRVVTYYTFGFYISQEPSSSSITIIHFRCLKIYFVESSQPVRAAGFSCTAIVKEGCQTYESIDTIPIPRV